MPTNIIREQDEMVRDFTAVHCPKSLVRRRLKEYTHNLIQTIVAGLPEAYGWNVRKGELPDGSAEECGYDKYRTQVLNQLTDIISELDRK